MAAGILAGSAPAFARGGGGGVQASGSCGGGSTWKLSAKPDNGRLEVEFEVDQNVVGDTWKVVMKDNGTAFFKGQRDQGSQRLVRGAEVHRESVGERHHHGEGEEPLDR
jgi:hypothetical protein